MVAALLVTRWAYGDVFELVRRVRPMRLPAEIQWRLLPPTAVCTDRVSLAGLLEPWDEVGGDAFDYALNDGRLQVALFDAMGHGLAATLLATLAVGAYRNSRRARLDLARMYGAIDRAIAAQFGGEHFVTGLLLDLDVATGALQLGVRRAPAAAAAPARPAGPAAAGAAGHPARAAASRRDRRRCTACSWSRATGWCSTPTAWWRPGGKGQFFSDERLADFVVRASASGHAGPEVLRRLIRAVLDHQDGVLQDDATVLLLEWGSPPD